MEVLKAGKTIYGAKLTAAERKAMNLEIQRQLAEYNDKNSRELEALILWFLHQEFGFGVDRLKRVYDGIDQSISDLVKRYELEESDDIWLCTRFLKEYGIDLEEWDKSRKKQAPL